MLPMFKKAHINTRDIEEYISKGVLKDFSENANKRNALKQASGLFKMVDGELYRHGSEREYKKYGLRIVVHDDEPQKKLDIISKCHLDLAGNHFGMNNTIRNVNNMYYWHGMSSHVKMFLKKCEYCKERSRFSMEEWLEEEKKNLSKRREMKQDMSAEIKNEIKSLGRIRKPTPPETFFIVNAERKIDFDKLDEGAEMLIDSNNIEYVVETLGNSETGAELKEVCHVLNVPDIVPMPERFRSREIENFLKSGSFPPDFTANMRSGLKGPAVQYSIIDGELYHDANKKNNSGLKLVIHDDNPALKVKVMVESHLDDDGTHLGLNRTLNRVSEKYFWCGMSLDVKKFMLHCKICSKNRGKRLEEDTSKFADEVKKLRAKEVYTGNEEVVTYTIGSVGRDNQGLKLVDDDDDDETQVTEITVKYVDGKIVKAVRDKGSEVVELTESQIKALVKVTETVTFEQETNSSSDLIIESNGQDLNENNTPEVIEVGDQEIESESPLVIAPLSTGQNDDSGEKQIHENNKEENASADNTTDNTVAVDTAIKLLVDNEVCVKEGFSNTVTIYPDGTIQSESEAQESTMNYDSDVFYDNMIYVPKLKKTRAMEEFLKTRTATFGFTTTKLRELTTNYFLEDNVLFRRPSRYKGKQVVIHDDQPMVKLKILKQHHTKPNGVHCREHVTFMNVQYKFYWEELRLDVNRFFRSCTKCVRDGIEILTKKRVLNEEELLMKEEEARRRDAGANANRNRQFREEYRNRLETFRNWEKYGKEGRGSIRQEVVVEEEDSDSGANFKDEDIELQDESDVDINLDEEESDVEDTKMEESILTIYATRAQEEMIRKMFQDRGWTYKLDSMTRCPDQSQKPGEDDLHVMVMATTLEQDTAIQELFSVPADSTNTVEAADGTSHMDYKAENVQLPEYTPMEEELNSGTAQSNDTINTESSNTIDTESNTIDTESSTKIDAELDTMMDTKHYSGDQNPESVEVDSRKIDGTEIKVDIKKNEGNTDTVELNSELIEEINMEKDINIKKENIPIENQVTEANTPVKNNLKRGRSTRRTKEEITKSKVEVSDVPKGDKGTKRTMAEVNETPTESRRPRREIKRPRRFSPDRMDEEQKQTSPKKTLKVTEKSKSASMKESNEEETSSTDLKFTSSRGRRQTKLVSDSKFLSDNKVNSPRAKKSIEIPDKLETNYVESPVRGTRSRSKKTSDAEVSKQLNTGKKVKPIQPVSQTKSTSRAKATVVAVVSTDKNDKKTVTNDKGSKRNSVKLKEQKTNELVNSDQEEEQVSDDDCDPDYKEDLDDEMTDSDISDDDEDDGFTDDDDINDDCLNDVTRDKAALQVLNIEKEYVMEIICVDGIYMCSLCDAEFQSEGDCRIHGMQNKCYEACDLSGKIFKKKEKTELEKHMALLKSMEKEICCPICKKRFLDTCSLNIHLRVHANLKNEICSVCDASFYTSFQLASHMYREHNKSDQFTCDVCNAKFVNIKFMKSEILFDGSLSYFKCVMCVK